MRDLLGTLAKKCFCSYISDLPSVYHQRLDRETILSIPDGLFSLAEWMDVLEYLTGKKYEVTTIYQIKQILIKEIKQQ